MLDIRLEIENGKLVLMEYAHTELFNLGEYSNMYILEPDEDDPEGYCSLDFRPTNEPDIHGEGVLSWDFNTLAEAKEVYFRIRNQLEALPEVTIIPIDFK